MLAEPFAWVQDCLALGAIFATTDSVAVLQVLEQDRAPLLFSFVFGEGVINDATTVALLRTVQVSPPVLQGLWWVWMTSHPCCPHQPLMLLQHTTPTQAGGEGGGGEGLCVSTVEAGSVY